MADYIVESGEVSSNLVINNGDRLEILSGGSVFNTVVSRGGSMFIPDGGVANGVITSSGYVTVSSGGTMLDANLADGGIFTIIQKGGILSSAIVRYGTWLEVFGSAYNIVLSNGKGTGDRTDLCVKPGGYVENLTIHNDTNFLMESGAIVNGLVLVGSDIMYSIADGTRIENLIQKPGTFMNVNAGVTVDGAVVSSGGTMKVFFGGTANGIVENGGYVDVAAGANVAFAPNTFSGLELTNASATIHAGTTANEISLNSNGYLYVFSGGTANNTIVNPSGYMFVSSGGTATGLVWTPCNGTLWVEDGAYVTYASHPEGVFYGGGGVLSSQNMIIENIVIMPNQEMYIMSNGLANSASVSSGGTMFVSSGGTANNTTVFSSGYMHVFSGGTAAHIKASSGAILDLSIAHDTYIEGTFADSAFEIKGGSATYYSVNSNNILRISSGGVASRAYVYAGGSLFVSNGGTASRTTVSNGTMSILSGGVADSTTVNGGYLHVSSGGVASNIANNGNVTVSNGASIDTVNVKNECWLYVLSGGTATNVTASSTKLCFDVAPDTFIDGTSNGSSFEIKDGMVSDYGVYQSGWLNILSGCTANNITVNLSGFMGVEGVANSVIIHGSGNVTVSSGGLVNSVTVNNYGRMYVSGGTANYTTVNGGQYCYVSVFSGTANYAIVNGGSMKVSCGPANNATVNGGSMYVSYGAANNAIVNGGYMKVFSGTADNAIVNGGSMYVADGSASNVSISKGSLRLSKCTTSDIKIYSGGIVSAQENKFTGKITIADGGVIHAGQGTVIDFDISRIAPNMGALLNNLSLIQDDAPAFTLTVSDLQWNGTYKLAQGVNEFDNLISVKSTASETIHMVAVDETANVDGIEYTLKLTDDTLSVTVTGGRDIPIIPVSADITDPTRTPVVVTAAFSDTAVMREYSFDNETWYVYVEPVTCSVNGTVYFLGKDQRGFVNEIASYEVTNIANRPPDNPVVVPNITAPTNTDVLVSATFEEDAIGEYSFDSETWQAYTEPVRFERNGTVHFRARDEMGNESEVVSYEVTNIDKAKPVVTLTGDNQTPLQKSALTAIVDDGSAILYRINNSGEWTTYTGTIMVLANASYSFKATDAAGNTGTAEITFKNIDTTPPVLTLTADTVTPSNSVTLIAETNEETVISYSSDNKNWTTYEGPFEVKANGRYYFKAVDVAGNVDNAEIEFTNIDAVSPTAPTGLRSFVDGQDVALVWKVSTDDFSGVKEYLVSYSLDGQEFTAKTANSNYVLNNADFGTYSWSVQAVDFAGNESAIVAGDAFTISGFKPYTVEYSADNFEHVITFAVTTPELDAFRMPAGTYQMRVKQDGSSEWMTGDPIVASETDIEPQLIKSDADSNADVFFANPIGTWESGYMAQHVGSTADAWGGTNEYAAVFGKNKLVDIIEGSTDANILLMTDDENGDALFVDDIYSALPGSVTEQQSRIAQIDEIRAGVGADIVDMTSQRFEYIGDGMTIRGGAGNDTIWANKGDNFLFGDAGNDRIVGASGNDIIAGGIGNDRLHGGGGDDVFTFCDNWGVDNVEQLANGSVTLWFASGDELKWDSTSMTYTDGDNSIKVTGVTAEQVKLKFGDDGSAQFASLTSMGAFFDATTERIFEESGKGILASL